MIGQGLHIAASSSLKGSSESGGQLKDRISKKKMELRATKSDSSIFQLTLAPVRTTF